MAGEVAAFTAKFSCLVFFSSEIYETISVNNAALVPSSFSRMTVILSRVEFNDAIVPVNARGLNEFLPVTETFVGLLITLMTAECTVQTTTLRKLLEVRSTPPYGTLR